MNAMPKPEAVRPQPTEERKPLNPLAVTAIRLAMAQHQRAIGEILDEAARQAGIAMADGWRIDESTNEWVRPATE